MAEIEKERKAREQAVEGVVEILQQKADAMTADLEQNQTKLNELSKQVETARKKLEEGDIFRSKLLENVTGLESELLELAGRKHRLEVSNSQLGLSQRNTGFLHTSLTSEQAALQEVRVVSVNSQIALKRQELQSLDDELGILT